MRHFEPLPEMNDMQFQQWVKLLEQRTGMLLPPERKSFLVTNLGLRMREIGCSSYQEYYDLVRSKQGLREWSTLVDRITVHETRFFRHPQSLDMVRDFVAAKPTDPKSGKVSVQAWSVACSTGEEAYSLAMVIDQALQQREQPAYFGITATDISPASLATGRKGVYTDRRVTHIEPALRDEYFTRLPDGKFQANDYLRKRICFARMNVQEIDKGPVGEMDIIYCQNLLIYFDRDARTEIVNNMLRHLAPGGLMVLGSGELLNLDNDNIEKISNPRVLAFRRKTADQESRSS
jgi:chemotaxis methyl-accepting protein methylase